MKHILHSVFIVLVLASMAFGQATLSSTTLGAAVDASQTYITVASASGIDAPTGSVINSELVIDKEALRVMAVSGLRLTVVRGVHGTSGMKHASGATVYFGAPDKFYVSAPFNGTPCTSAQEKVLPHVTYAGEVYNCISSTWVKYAPEASQFSTIKAGTSSAYPYTLSFTTPSAARTITFTDPGGSANVAYKNPTTAQTITNTYIDSTVTLTSTTPSVRLIRGEFTTDSMTSGTVVSVRGATTVPTGKTITSGYIYGTQGKVILTGTSNTQSGGGIIAGIFGQLDASSATITNTGDTAAGWFDLSGGPSGAAAKVMGIGITNSTAMIAGAVIHVGTTSGGFSNLFDIQDTTSTLLVTTSGTSAGQCAQTDGLVPAKAIPVKIGASQYYIPVCTGP